MNFLISVLILFIVGFILSGILMLFCGIFKIEFRKRKKPYISKEESMKFTAAWDNLKMEVFKALRIPQIVEWLNKLIKK